MIWAADASAIMGSASQIQRVPWPAAQKHQASLISDKNDSKVLIRILELECLFTPNTSFEDV